MQFVAGLYHLWFEFFFFKWALKKKPQMNVVFKYYNTPVISYLDLFLFQTKIYCAF